MKMPTDDVEGQITKPCTQNWKTRSSLKVTKNGLKYYASVINVVNCQFQASMPNSKYHCQNDSKKAKKCQTAEW